MHVSKLYMIIIDGVLYAVDEGFVVKMFSFLFASAAGCLRGSFRGCRGSVSEDLCSSEPTRSAATTSSL